MLSFWEGDTSREIEDGKAAEQRDICGPFLNAGALSHVYNSEQSSRASLILPLLFASGETPTSGMAGSRCSDNVPGSFSITQLCFSACCSE